MGVNLPLLLIVIRFIQFMKKNITISCISFLIGIIIAILLMNVLEFNINTRTTNSIFIDNPNFVYLFLNNITNIIILFFSFGVLTIPILMYQGFQLGFLIIFAYNVGLSIIEIVFSILPHGIIEIPLMIIAGAIGIGSYNALKADLPNSIKNYYSNNKHIIHLVSFFILIAAIIETFITPIFLRRFL